jgi:hypothetical protein
MKEVQKLKRDNDEHNELLEEASNVREENFIKETIKNNEKLLRRLSAECLVLQ